MFVAVTAAGDRLKALSEKCAFGSSADPTHSGVDWRMADLREHAVALGATVLEQPRDGSTCVRRQGVIMFPKLQRFDTAPALTYEMMRDDVVGVMDAVTIERADIEGWSDGGNVPSTSRGAIPIASASWWRSAPTALLPPVVPIPRRSRSPRTGRRTQCYAPTLHVREELADS
jgi:hypothetical protein